MKYFKPFKDAFSSEEYYERVHPASGCIFAPLGILMSALMVMMIVFLFLDFNIQVLPVTLFLGCLVYFCFSRCFARVYFGMYPTHITIHNRKILWQDIKDITLQIKNKYCFIKIDLNDKALKRNIIILSILLVIAISIGIIIFTTPDMPKENMFFLVIFLPAMFGIDTFRPRRKVVPIDPLEDTEEVMRLIKHYAEQYKIPCHIPAEYEKDDKIISN